MATKKDNRVYITKTQVKERGWTEGSITQFLGTPDKEKRNPRSASAPTIKLFLLDRVDRAEQEDGFIHWFNKHKGRREKLSTAALDRANEKRQALFDYIDSLDITLPAFNGRQSLYREAIKHYNDLWWARGEFDKCASLGDDKEFLNRIAVNMLRHRFTDYEAELDRLYGQIGRAEGYERLKQRVNSEINRQFPFLLTPSATT